MNSVLMNAAWIGLVLSTLAAPSFAQLRDNSEKQMTCNDGNNGDRARHCEIREMPMPSMARIGVETHNGGVTIKGSMRGDVLVRARVEASADTEAAAAALVSRVSLDTSGGQIKAVGPENADNSWWSVSFEIFVPQNTDLDLKSHNGGMTISDVRGQIHFEGHNGGVHLKRLAGDVTGSTMNGGIQVDLTGAIWEGRQLDVSTHNGGVDITAPSYYSAHIQAETVSGGLHSDFPMPVVDLKTRPRKIDTNIGSGGPLIHISTHNGGINLKRVESAQ
jgi:DUF4097 and DUF4098 domain-containing protein YvlB